MPSSYYTTDTPEDYALRVIYGGKTDKILSLDNIKQLVFAMQTHCVLCEVRTKYLCDLT